ncbi:hypothetical protein EON79_01080 [bacterium]|nr:MAG: hypothetical protein EON79_01080 [bacterium]
MSAVPALYVEVPGSLRDALLAELDASQLPRWVLEAIVIEAVREGRVTTGYASEVLSLGYFEFERLLQERGVPFDMSDEEIEAGNRDLLKLFPR